MGQSETNPPSVADHAYAVLVRRQADGSVTVRRDYRGGDPRVAARWVSVACVVLCVVPVAVLVATPGGWAFRGSAAVVASVFAGPLATRLARQFAAGTTSWLLRADRGGLTVEASTYRGRTVRQFARGQVADVTLDCSGGTDPHHTVFRSMLVIRPTVGRPVRCLHDAGGDHLAQAADAIRSALGLPARAWP